jgi:hypothetical protein
MQRRGHCETVSQMIKQGWDVISRCDHCGLMMQVNLRVVAVVRGGDFSLWNKKTRCRRIGCQGWTSFQARAPGMHYHQELAAPWPVGRPGP